MLNRRAIKLKNNKLYGNKRSFAFANASPHGVDVDESVSDDGHHGIHIFLKDSLANASNAKEFRENYADDITRIKKQMESFRQMRENSPRRQESNVNLSPKQMDLLYEYDWQNLTENNSITMTRLDWVSAQALAAPRLSGLDWCKLLAAKNNEILSALRDSALAYYDQLKIRWGRRNNEWKWRPFGDGQPIVEVARKMKAIEGMQPQTDDMERRRKIMVTNAPKINERRQEIISALNNVNHSENMGGEMKILQGTTLEDEIIFSQNMSEVNISYTQKENNLDAINLSSCHLVFKVSNATEDTDGTEESINVQIASKTGTQEVVNWNIPNPIFKIFKNTNDLLISPDISTIIKEILENEQNTIELTIKTDSNIIEQNTSASTYTLEGNSNSVQDDKKRGDLFFGEDFYKSVFTPALVTNAFYVE